MDDRFARLYSIEAQVAQPSAIREMCRLADRPNIKSLAGGWPDPAVFPSREIAEITADVLAADAPRALQYGPSEGLAELRQALAQWSQAEDKIACRAEEIIILHGSQQGLDLCVRVFLRPGETVMVGLPTYLGGAGAIKGRGGLAVGVEVDEQGLDVARLGREVEGLIKQGQRVKGVYVIPNFQNPSGVTLSLDRRRLLLHLAERHDFMIFEDDPYGDLRFEGPKIPSLKALDETGRVVHLRSLSKTFSAGLRLGWLVGERGAVSKMVTAKQFIDTTTNSLTQLIFLEFMRRGHWRRSIERGVAHYRRKRDVMLELLERHFPEEVRWNRPAGGFFIFVHLPQDMESSSLLSEAVAHDVAFVSGEPFFVDGRGRNTLRLSYSQASEADIEMAVKVLGRLIKKRLTQAGRAA